MDKYNIKEELKQFIFSGLFIDAQRLIGHLPFAELVNTLCELADDSESIIVYSFACFLLTHKENAAYHSIASLLLAQPLSFIEGAYSASLFHIRRCLELDPENIEYMESILFFYRIPDQLITKEEAIRIAQKIIKNDPNNSSALRIVSDLMDYSNAKIES